MNFVPDPSPVSNERFYETPPENIDTSSSDLPGADDLIHDRIESQPASSASENLELDDMLSIAEPAKAKAKGRPRGSVNKKGTMTRAEKKAAKSTKQDLSGFEHVEQEFEAKAKRTKKTTSQAKTDREGRGREGEDRGGRGRRGRGGATTRGRDGAAARGRGGAVTSMTTTSIVTRSGTTASAPMELSSNTESSDAEVSGDGFNNLPESSSDEDFNASRHGDEDAEDDWMY